MKEDQRLINNLNKIFSSKKFMQSLMQDENDFSPRIFGKMGIVLDYYISTRDNNINYTYKQIEEKFDELDFESLKDNIITNGFMTHSFNGYKKDMIAKNGLDYMKSISEQEKEKIQERRSSLNELESILGKSRFVTGVEENEKSNYANSVYICSPGAKTFYYACKRSPERLYEGPLKDSDNEPIIVGENKTSYLLRILEKKIKAQYSEENVDQINHAMKIAEKVIEDYATSSPAFAMLKIDNIKGAPASLAKYEENNAQQLEKWINDSIGYEVKQFFSQNPNDHLEHNNLGDIVTHTEFVPSSAISIIECMDEFEMQQIFAKSKGLKVGDFIDYTQEKKLGNPSIDMLKNVIKDCKDSTTLTELNEKYISMKTEYDRQIEEQTKILSDKYPGLSLNQIKEELLNRKEELADEKEKILDNVYLKKEGISTDYTLRDALKDIEQSGLKNKLLKSDEKIKNDPLQYKSDIHGVSHTRRVNFLATLIMSSENVGQNTENVIRAIVQNHDIGRTNDIEDKEHGDKSVKVLEENSDRIESLSNKEKEILRFVIKEHSLSARENEEDLTELFQRKIEEKTEEKFSEISKEKFSKYLKKDDIKTKIQEQVTREVNSEKENLHHILDICKDADKLDRVRLDPRGMYPREGLNASRLSLESSKGLENVAYESLFKVLPILDIERENQDIDQEITQIDNLLKLKEESSKGNEFEMQMKMAEEGIGVQKKEFLRQVTSGKRFSKVKNIVEKIKSAFIPKDNTKEK